MMPPVSGSPRRRRRASGIADESDAPPRDDAPGRSAGDADADEGAAADPPWPPLDSSEGITPGMAMVRQAVTFTNAQVLEPTANLPGTVQPVGMDCGADALADSAGAMMLQDMRAYLQSTEMILVPVTAAAFGEILFGDKERGEAALTDIQKMLGYLTAFSADVITNAATIEADFG